MRGLFALGTLLAALLTASSPAAAATLPTSEYRPSILAASSSGWSYVAASTPVSAWRWSSSGWSAASLGVGASVRAYPFGSGWHWAYRDSTWYAVRTTSLASWSCTSSGGRTGRIYGVAPGDGVPLYRFNTTTSQRLVTVPDGAIASFSCGNLHPAAEASPVPQVIRGSECLDPRIPLTADVRVSDLRCGSQPCEWSHTSPPPGAYLWAPPCDPVPQPFRLVRVTVHGASYYGYVHGVTSFTKHWCYDFRAMYPDYGCPLPA